MDKEEKKIKDIYDKLSDNNKDIVNMVAKGMILAQENIKKE